MQESLTNSTRNLQFTPGTPFVHRGYTEIAKVGNDARYVPPDRGCALKTRDPYRLQ